MKIIKDIAYGPYEDNNLDLYLPDTDSFDLFMYIHGGGLEQRNKDWNPEVFTYLAERGIAAAPINYRKYPTAKYPDFVVDSAAAAAWLKENIHLYGNCRRIFIGGSSAGGYLSMMLCFDPRWLGAHGLKNTDFFAYVLDAGQPTKHFKVLKEQGIDTRRVIIDDTAPLYHVGETEEFPPMYIIVSDNDIKNRYEQIQLLLSTLKQFGCDEDKIHYELRHSAHCKYVDAFDENNETVFGKMIYDYIKSF